MEAAYDKQARLVKDSQRDSRDSAWEKKKKGTYQVKTTSS
jgi:hypothetical protein